MKPQFDLSQAEGMPHFTIEGTMPSLNEYLAETGRHPKAGYKVKKEYVNTAIMYWRLSDYRDWVATKPVITHFCFYEPNLKRDSDNITSCAVKFIHDALRDIGVVKDDNREFIQTFTHDFYLDRVSPRIEVYIEEINDEE